LNRTVKQEQVELMHEKLKRAKAVFLADFRGMNVEKATTLRNELRAAAVEYKVFKNSLLELASRETDFECLQPHLAGPTAVAISYDDPVSAAKVLSKFAKVPQGAFVLKAGVLSGKLLDVAQIQALADLPHVRCCLPRCWVPCRRLPRTLLACLPQFLDHSCACLMLFACKKKVINLTDLNELTF